MKIKVTTIDFEIPSRTKRIALFIAIPVLMVGASAVAIANVPNSFKDGDTLSAQKMNDNFSALDVRASALETGRFIATINGKKYSVGATQFTKATVKQYTGLIGNYNGAKGVCEGETGSPSAHMCTTDEIVRTAAAGVSIAQGWYSSGVFSLVLGDSMNDCAAWQQAGAGYRGTFWNGTGALHDACGNPHPILCCD